MPKVVCEFRARIPGCVDERLRDIRIVWCGDKAIIEQTDEFDAMGENIWRPVSVDSCGALITDIVRCLITPKSATERLEHLREDFFLDKPWVHDDDSSDGS